MTASRMDQPPWLWPRAVYIHIPFCAHHCGYCDFAVAAGRDDKIDVYLEALANELAKLDEPQPIETIFLGGGTPTHLASNQLDRLLSLIAQWFELADDGEFSVEANPGTLTEAHVRVLADHGVNRVSLGSQSFQPQLLKVLERDHHPDDVPRAVDMLRRHIPRLSLDLIFGVPGQTMAMWVDDVQQVLALQPEHVSTYGLTFEKGTRLWKQLRQGQIQPLDEDTELQMYLHGMDALADAGLQQYEISNFARPGQQSRHNQRYWANHAYFGFGMGAARYINGRRELNTRSLDTYLARILAGESATFQTEQLPPEERARETIALNLRRCEGVHIVDFREQTGFEFEVLVGEIVTPLVKSGHLERDDSGVRLTRQGRCVADHIVKRFWN